MNQLEASAPNTAYMALLQLCFLCKVYLLLPGRRNKGIDFIYIQIYI